MRKYSIAFFVTVIFTVMLVVLVALLNPLKEDAVMELVKAENIKSAEELKVVLAEIFAKGLGFEYLNLQNFLIAAGVLGMAITTGVGLLHMIFERLFLLKFYEEPLVLRSMRRGAVVALLVIGIGVLRILGVELYVLVAYVVLLLAAEIALTTTIKEKPLIKAEYRGDAEVLASESEALATHIKRAFDATIGHIYRSLKTAYLGTRSKLSQNGEAEPVLPLSESVVISDNEPDATGNT